MTASSDSPPSGAVWAEEAGDESAPLIALIHGTMDRSTGMLKLSRRLDHRFRVLRYDRRGYGRSIDISATPGATFDMHAQVADLIGLLDGRPAILVGHSYGGDVALAAAANHPDLVAGVAVYETPLSWEPWWPGSTAGGAAQASAGDPGEAAERFMRRLVGDALWERLPERTRATRRSEGAALVGELRDLSTNPPWRASQIRCPLVVGLGTRGAAHHQRGMRFLHDSVPGSILVELADARHDAPLSHAEVFAREIVEPLARLVGGQWATAIDR